MVIKTLSLDHKGGFYFYRVHEAKSSKLCNGNGFIRLKEFLDEVFDKCPNEYFKSGPRGSNLKFRLKELSLIQVNGHEVSELAKLGLKENHERYKSNHSKVQVFMLENDNKSVAVEVPIWLEKKEMKKLDFLGNEPLTGHIDLLRVDNDKIWIWDYKPGALMEKYAATQIYFYALMLAKRTGISLDNFRCGYFDSENALMFKPEEKMLESKDIEKLSKFF